MHHLVKILCFCAILQWFLFSQNVNAQSSHSHGEIGLNVGTTSIPIYPRGEGNNEHYEGHFNINTTYKRATFRLGGILNGGSTFDNPDGFHLFLGLDIKLQDKLYLILEHTDNYALNHPIIRDPQARTGGSSVNAWWVGLKYVSDLGPIRITTNARHMFAGNEPLFFTHFTRPYALESFGSILEIFPNYPIRGQISNQFYFHGRFNELRLESSGSIRFFITDHSAIELSAKTIQNYNEPIRVVDFRNRKLRNRGGAFIGFVYVF